MWLDALQNTPPVNELTSGRLAIETICLYCLVAFVQGTGVGEFNHRLFNLCSFMLLSLVIICGYIYYILISPSNHPRLSVFARLGLPCQPCYTRLPWLPCQPWLISHLLHTGSGGLFGIIRSQLWLSVTQYTSRQVQVDIFKHIHG